LNPCLQFEGLSLWNVLVRETGILDH